MKRALLVSIGSSSVAHCVLMASQSHHQTAIVLRDVVHTIAAEHPETTAIGAVT